MAHFTTNPATGFPPRAGFVAFWHVRVGGHPPGEAPRMLRGITNTDTPWKAVPSKACP